MISPSHVVIFLFLFCLSQSPCRAQATDDSLRSVSIAKTLGVLKIDGELNEPEWQQSEVMGNFFNHFPDNRGYAKNKTEVRLLFSDRFLYVSAVCYYSKGHKFVVQSLKRDTPWWISDSFSILLDPSGNKTNGLMFNVGASGAQGDAIIGNQAITSTYNVNWDVQWFSATTIHDDRYVIEMAIPFRSLRYTAEKGQWGIQFIRHDMEYSNNTTWNWVPINLVNYSLLRTGTLEWTERAPAFKGNIFIAPFVTAGTSKAKGETGRTNTSEVGLDAKVAITSALNLDVTINPDFSQVDVDQQVVNLTRFSLFFPEKRFFFLENSDMFSNMGIAPIRPFFSRTIGLRNGQAIPLLGGLRLTGSVAKNTRIGLMNMTQQPNDSSYQNYTVGAFQQTVFKNSLLQGMFTNVQTFGDHRENTFDYNRTAGLEFKYLSDNKAWNVIGRWHEAFREDVHNDNRYLHLGITYNVKKWYIDANILGLGKNYVNDLGFTPRLYQYDPLKGETHRVGYVQNFTEVHYRMFTREGSRITYHGPKLTADTYYRGNSRVNEADILLLYELNFRDQSYMTVGVRDNYVNLFYPLHLVEGDVEPLPVQAYQFTTSEFFYESAPGARFGYSLGTTAGDFYNGTRFSINPSVRLRLQPRFNLRAYYNYDNIKFREGYGEQDFHLVGSSLEVLFSTKMFWTTFFQYNTQLDNVNVNSRFQWRFKPLSDLFIVYTDNYTNDFTNKNRGVVVKFVYWMGLNK